MVSLASTKFVNDIVSWKISHPKDIVNLFFRRKSTGERYYTCSSPPHTNNRPLFLSCEDLSRVFDEVNTWVNEKYISSSVTNSWGVAITGGEDTDTKRLTLVFSLHNNIEAIELRSWWRNNPEGVFRPSSYGFMIVGRENITSFIKMREEISKREAEVSKLDDLINTAHNLLYTVYNENYM